MGDQRVPVPTTEQVAQAAYLLWESEGRPQGRDLTHWLRAERQLSAAAHGAPLAQEPGAKPGTDAPKRSAAVRRSGSKRSEASTR